MSAYSMSDGSWKEKVHGDPWSIVKDGVEDLVKAFRPEVGKNMKEHERTMIKIDKEIKAEWTALFDTWNQEMVRRVIKEIRNEEFRVVVGSHDRRSRDIEGVQPCAALR